MSGARFWNRLNGSAIFWSWAFNFFRLASGVLLLPLLLRQLPLPDLGMHYLLLSLAVIVIVLDNAFAFNLNRFTGYAMGGATEIRPLGMGEPVAAGEPNHPLVWELLLATRALYRRVALLTMGLLAVLGYATIAGKVAATSWPELTWLAAALTVVGAGVEIYSSWWNSFLRGMNRVRDGARIAALAYAVRLGLSCGFLLGGLGLAAVPLAGILASLGQRWFSRRCCLRVLPASARPAVAPPVGDLLARLWPNSWRAGLQLLSRYAATAGASVLCLHTLGLEANARYGLAVQILSMVLGMASVWTAVIWPRVSQLRAQGNADEIRRLFRPRVWYQNLTYLALALPLIWLGEPLLRWLGSGKALLPSPWLELLALNLFLELNFSFWATLLATENRVPSLWATVAGNLAGLALAIGLVLGSGYGLGGIVLGPLLAGGAFNYWYWGLAGARNLRTTWLRFTFGRE